ncbi:MAG TPA: cupin domain-containing protein [Candidatus Krumholzibacteria bacterium]|nr:cupin domain-containing protein [Candidatus Krumholzibacteria bacterium]
MPPRASRIEQLVTGLALEPHPEGGFYREFYRSAASVEPDDGRSTRSAFTAIYFLLRAGDVSRWHRVRSDEQWTHIEGGRVELFVIDPVSFRLTTHVLGGECATAVVPAGAWQAARPGGEFALVTCGVGPGFDFADFAFMTDDTVATQHLREAHAGLAALLG